MAPPKAQNLTVKITKTDGSEITRTNQVSFSEACYNIYTNNIEQIEISAGKFTLEGWEWLYDKKNHLTNLSHFAITNTVDSVAEMKATGYYIGLFSWRLKYISVAKLKTIPSTTLYGISATYVNFPDVSTLKDYAITDCSNLQIAIFPKLDSIANGVFNKCYELSNIVLGATPPNMGSNIFDKYNIIDKYLVIADSATGVPLTGTALATAQAAYKAANDGNTADNFWYNFNFGSTLHKITINPATINGKPECDYHYLPAGKTATLTYNTNAGFAFSNAILALEGGSNVTINSNTFTMPDNNLSITANYIPNTLNVTVNGSINKTGSTLENALNGITLNTITSLKITGGDFNASDWTWMGNNSYYNLNKLTHFTITNGAGQVADMPNGNVFFPKSIQEINIAKMKIIGSSMQYLNALRIVNLPDVIKIKSGVFYESRISQITCPNVVIIGSSAFYNCKNISKLYFPKLKIIDYHTFTNCSNLHTVCFPSLISSNPTSSQNFASGTSLVNIMFGATPPKIYIYDFNNSASPRYLIPVDAAGVPLTGTALSNAFAAYKAEGDGNTTDSLWYGCSLYTTTYKLTINPAISNGAVEANCEYAPAGKTIQLNYIPAAGYTFSNATYTPEGGSAINITGNTFTMPDKNVSISANFTINTLNVTVNGSINKTGNTLENALNGIALNTITSLKITGGKFNICDWIWLKDNRYNLNSLTHFTITNSVEQAADIPDTEYKYAYCGKNIQELNIAKVKKIGAYAFGECKSLRIAKFADAEIIESNAFKYCRGLTEIDFPNVVSIRCAFQYCSALTEASFPKATNIEEGAFIDNVSLKKVYFPKITDIYNFTFNGCTSLNIAFFPKLTYIGTGGFQKCPSFNNFILGATPPTANFYPFNESPTPRYLVIADANGVPLTGSALATARAAYKAVNDGNTSDSLWKNWDFGKTLYKIAISATMSNGTILSNYEYAPAGKVINITYLPNNGYALSNATYTPEGGSAINIYGNTFIMPDKNVSINANFAINTLNVTVNGSINKTGTNIENALNGIPFNSIVSLKITSGDITTNDWFWLYNAYRSNDIWSLKYLTITNGAGVVADMPCMNDPYFNATIEEVNIAKMNKINENVFYMCRKLKVAKFPDATIIGDNAFQECISLQTIEFPELTEIGICGFYYCESLKNINFPKLTKIADLAFGDCKSILSATFPVLSQTINSAFGWSYIPNFKNILLGATPPNVYENLFNYCPSPRYLTPVDAAGVPLTGAALNNAIAAYKAIDDGNTTDSLWYGWSLGKTLYKVGIDPSISNGVVEPNYSYCPADTTVTIAFKSNDGYSFSNATYTPEGGSAINITGNTFIMPNKNVNIIANFVANTLNVTVNNNINKTGNTLENALNGVTLNTITSLKITSGNFNTCDWLWLKDNKKKLQLLTYFTITDGIAQVADIPNIIWYDSSYFSNAIREVNIAKVNTIGELAFNANKNIRIAKFPNAKKIYNNAFWECDSLSTIDFPQVEEILYGAFYNCTSLKQINFPKVKQIQNGTFRSCTSLQLAVLPRVNDIKEDAFNDCSSFTNIFLGATPPIVASHSFFDCANTRYISFVDSLGAALTGTNLDGAIAAYKAIDDGSTTDSLWHGWIFGKKLYQITINSSISNGVVNTTSSGYEMPNAHVTIITTPNAGYQLKAGSLKAYKTGDESIVVAIAADNSFIMPAYDVMITAAFEPVNAIENVAGLNFAIYPNPATNSIFIEADGIKVITITDILGKELLKVNVKEGTKEQISLANLENGVYFVSVNTNRGVATKKLIIKK